MKKKILHYVFLFAFITSSQIASAQWTSVAPIYAGAIANDGAVSFSINSKGYVLSGSSTSTFYEYDTLLNTWTPLGNIPANMGHAFGMSFVLNDKAYIIGGDTSGVPVNTVWEFNPSASNPWSQKNNFPGGIRDAGFAFAIGGFGYVGAGFDGNNIYNDIWKYDQPNDLWTQLNSLPIAGMLFPTSFVIGNNGYILTGGTPPSGLNETKKMWCLDGTTGLLTPKTDFPGSARQAAFAFSNNMYGYVGGGQAGFAANFNDMWQYDPTQNQWAPAPAAPMLGAAWSSVFVIGNTAYAGLGAKFVGSGLTGTDIFYKISMDIGTGIENISSGSPSIYPNPAIDYIHFNFDNRIDHLKIYDVTGKLLEEISQPSDHIYIGNLPNGYYNIKISGNNNSTVGKFIKQ